MMYVHIHRQYAETQDKWADEDEVILCMVETVCQVLPKVPELSGIAASSDLMQRYSPAMAVIAVETKWVSHHAQEWGRPP